MITAVWILAAGSALLLRRGIRWHKQRWLLRVVNALRPAVRTRPRRLLLDPLHPIIPTRRLLT